MPKFEYYEDLEAYLATIDNTPVDGLSTGGGVVSSDPTAALLNLLPHRPSGVIPPDDPPGSTPPTSPTAPPPPVTYPPAYIAPALTRVPINGTLTQEQIDSIIARGTNIQIPGISSMATSDSKWVKNSDGTTFINNKLWCSQVKQPLSVTVTSATSYPGDLASVYGITNGYNDTYESNMPAGPWYYVVSGGLGKLTCKFTFRIWENLKFGGTNGSFSTNYGAPSLLHWDYGTLGNGAEVIDGATYELSFTSTSKTIPLNITATNFCGQFSSIALSITDEVGQTYTHYTYNGPNYRLAYVPVDINVTGSNYFENTYYHYKKHMVGTVSAFGGTFPLSMEMRYPYDVSGTVVDRYYVQYRSPLGGTVDYTAHMSAINGHHMAWVGWDSDSSYWPGATPGFMAMTIVSL